MRFITLTVCISGLLALSAVVLADSYEYHGRRPRYQEDEISYCRSERNECNLCNGGDGDPDPIDPSLVRVCGSTTCSECTKQLCNECLVPLGGICSLSRMGGRSNCVPGSVCDRSLGVNSTSGRCIGICTSDSQCPTGSSCVNGVCGGAGASCTISVGCAPGFTCANGVCIATICNDVVIACPTGTTCSPNSLCVVQACSTALPGGCPAGSICSNGFCQQTCINAAQCGRGNCVNGLCEIQCTFNFGCPQNFTCSIPTEAGPPGFCVAPLCSNSVPCPAGSGLLCIGGRCAGAPSCNVLVA